MLKTGETVSVYSTVPHRNKDFGDLTPDIKLTVLQVVDKVVLVCPWNSGHETLVRASNLRRVPE